MNDEPITSRMVFFVIVVLFSLIATGAMIANYNHPQQKIVKLHISAESPCYDLVNVSTVNQSVDIYNAMVVYNCFPNNKGPE